MPVCLRPVYIAGKMGVSTVKPGFVSDEAGTPLEGGVQVQMLIVDTKQSDVSTCTYVVQSGAEVASSLLYSLSAADGGYLSAAVLSVWAAAYGIRQVINVIRGSTEA